MILQVIGCTRWAQKPVKSTGSKQCHVSYDWFGRRSQRLIQPETLKLIEAKLLDLSFAKGFLLGASKHLKKGALQLPKMRGYSIQKYPKWHLLSPLNDHTTVEYSQMINPKFPNTPPDRFSVVLGSNPIRKE